MKHYLIIFIILLGFTLGLFASSNERLVIRIPSPDQAILNHYLKQQSDIAGYKPGVYLDLVIKAQDLSQYQINHPDMIITQTESNLKANLVSGTKAIPGYRDYSTMQDEIQALQTQYPNLLSTQVIGYGWGHIYASQYPTYAGFDHDIIAVKVSANVTLDEDEPAMYFCGAHHAREPMSVEVSMAIMNYLVSSYGVDPFVTNLLNTTQIWIVPMLNPDGHKIVMDQTDVWWRKNIRDNNNSHSFNHESYGYGDDGADINRNYGYLWGYISATDDINSPTYHGVSGFSEPETIAFKTLLESKPFIAGISYHTYGQYVLYPFGYMSNLYAPDETELRLLAEDVAGQINGQNSGYYDPMPSWELYPVSGSLDDWAYGTRGIFAYTVEMAEEFIPSATFVPQIVESNLNGAKRFLARRSRAMLQGHVTDATTGAPIPAFVYVEGIDESPIPRAAYRAYEQTGSYYRFLSEGTYTVRYYLEGYMPQTRTVSISNTSTTVEDVQLSPVAPQTVRIRILQDNSTELPLSGAELRIQTDLLSVHFSDENGNIFLNGFYPGAYRIDISKAGYNSIHGLFDLSDGYGFSLMQDPGLSDNFEGGLAMWTPQTPWGLSTSQSFSGSSSLTDSPSGNYQNNANSTCTLTTPISLIGAENIDLQLYTKYNIALDGDYAALEYTTDNLVWHALDYYNGVQDWTNKTYDLSGLSGSDIRFRMRFTSNSQGRTDGIYIDDIKLYVSYYTMVGTDDPVQSPAILNVSTSPNPFASELRIMIASDKALKSDLGIKIYNLKGQKVMERTFDTKNQKTIDLSWHPEGLSTGVYFVNISNGEQSKVSRKILYLK